MGYDFESSGSSVWSPSQNVARLFLASVRQLEKQMEKSSGLIEPMSDTIEIDSAVLAEFLRAVFAKTNWSHESLSIILHGPLVHMLALLLATNPAALKNISQIPKDWIQEAHLLIARYFHHGPD